MKVGMKIEFYGKGKKELAAIFKSLIEPFEKELKVLIKDIGDAVSISSLKEKK